LAILFRSTLCAWLLAYVRALDDSLRDLGAFIPIWRQGVSQRRALAFRGARRIDISPVADEDSPAPSS
jgi:hypothetical protein